MLQIKPIKQKKNYCGPACLQMVGNYYGIQKTQDQWAKKAKTSLSRGTSIQGMLKAARSTGMDAKMHMHVSWEQLSDWLDQKIPPIVNWFATDEGHYSIVVKVSKTHVYFIDPEFAKVIRMGKVLFAKGWKRRARKAFVLTLKQ